ncbi:MAG: SIR2 family protein [Planctomycetota bacterium]|nr:MAG: SIR2 family protein [Planctomycetota bacterium]
MMKRAMGRDGQLVGLSRDEVGELEQCIRQSIVETVNPDLGTDPEVFPHRAFARWVSKATRKFPVEIFTLNYDMLFEHALEEERIAVFDGFVGSSRPYFHAETLTQSGFMPGMMWTRLWKMHGSVNWSRATVRGSQRIVRGPVSEKGELIFPSFEKYDESRQQPYSAFTSRLRTFLEEDDALLVVLGYSFSDEHVNEVIYGALEASTRTHVYALQFDAIDGACALLKRAGQCRNLVVASPNCGAIGGVVGPWSKDAEMLAAQGVVDAGADGARSLRLGDFARFCTFLESMSER